MAPNFDHALNPDFIGKLAAEAKKEGWWADVLADPELLIFPRGSYLKVYWRGQSLFCVNPTPSGLKVTTHEKYLVNPELASQVSLTDGYFEIEALKDKGFIPTYKGPKATLAKMKRAARLFSGLEKTGCHEIAVRNSAVINVEITIPGKVSLDDGGKDKQLPRADLASLEPDGDKKALLVFGRPSTIVMVNFVRRVITYRCYAKSEYTKRFCPNTAGSSRRATKELRKTWSPSRKWAGNASSQP